MKIIDERETHKKSKNRKEQGGTEAIAKKLESNDFVVHLKVVSTTFLLVCF